MIVQQSLFIHLIYAESNFKRSHFAQNSWSPSMRKHQLPSSRVQIRKSSHSIHVKPAIFQETMVDSQMPQESPLGLKPLLAEGTLQHLNLFITFTFQSDSVQASSLSILILDLVHVMAVTDVL